MSKLIFDGTHHTLTLIGGDGIQVGSWQANNVVDRSATMRYVPNGVYGVLDPTKPLRHGKAVDKKGVLEDSTDGAYGAYGIIRLRPFVISGKMHSGVGIHSGRASKGGPNHPTMGCIRTTDAAMKAIAEHIAHDPLMNVVVTGNHVQHNIQPHHKGDTHLSPNWSRVTGQSTAWV